MPFERVFLELLHFRLFLIGFASHDQVGCFSAAFPTACETGLAADLITTFRSLQVSTVSTRSLAFLDPEAAVLKSVLAKGESLTTQTYNLPTRVLLNPKHC